MQKYLTSWLRNNYSLIALLLVAFLIYLPSLSGDFVIDDVPLIRDNPYIRDFSQIIKFFTKGVFANSALEMSNQSIYRPMNLVPMLLNYQLWGNNPFGYHIYLLLLHLANTCLVYALIRKLVAGTAVAATIGAAIFALHPARVESVAWIDGGIDPLVAFFLLGAFLAHLSFVNSIDNKKKWRSLALSLLCFQLALWSKEVAIIFPLIVVAHDLIYRRKINWPPVFLHTVVIAVYLIARSIVLGDIGKLSAITLSNFSRAIDFVLGYIELLVFPVRVPFYLHPPERAVSSALGIVGAMVIVMLAGFSWRTFNPDRKKALVFSTLWLIGFFWPAVLLAFYADGYYAARHLYVPMVGAAVFAAALYGHMNATYPRFKIPVMAACALAVTLYGFITWKEIPAWHDDGAIYGKIVGLAPENYSGFIGLGRFHLEREDYAAAERNFQIAVQKAPAAQTRLEALMAIGTLYGMHNKLDISERYLKEVVQIDPGNSDAWAGLGNLAWMQGQLDGAIPLYEKAVSINPENYEAAMNLAMAYEKTGQSGRSASIRQRAAAMRR